MNAPAFFFLLATIALVVVLIGFVVHAQSLREVNDAYARLSRRYAGRCFPAAAFQRPSLRFTYKGASVLIDVFSTGGKNSQLYTQFHITWPDRNLRMAVRPERLLSRVGKFLGMEDLEIGSQDFDDRYIITGNDLRTLQQLLNAEVQASINQLRLFMANDDIYVSISAGRLLVKKRGYIRQYSLLERFTSLSLELFDRSLLTTMDGIEFVEAEAGKLNDVEVHCQICGDVIREPPVCCASCKTPHHKDCWDYYGACSTYGCGQTRYATPRRQS